MSIDEIIKELERLAEGAEQTASVHWKADQGIKERHEYIASALRDAIALLRTHPDAQPNKPLTLEDLREMDGRPVWVERPGYGAHWAMVQVWAKSTNIIYLIYNNGAVLHPQVEIACGAKFYRRPQKECI